ncbi:hypothetical protein [Paraflavitalea sp. CAU 1676]|uniref:hypothetical protein n=1 Tax=Paraflavitalea sp. CAU 1676 TaxID=3032598 RepID=UPI0023DC6E3D|nr:hypothetical protein [Paraflavitalea sp. CAU 1676]MDF2190184.1 hypothetical protein [Paraflavitalea sp. CAU 1676]
MLIKQVHLEAIKAGDVTLAFRRWTKPSAKKGSIIKTSVGLVELTDIKEVSPGSITEAQSKAAGYPNKASLLDELNSRPAGTLYRITVQYHAPDPRIALRAQEQISKEEFVTLKAALERLDKYSKTGPWTSTVLLAIRDNPGLRAADLAHTTGKEKEWLKPNIRKLKEQGLTISLDPGYELSPRGAAFLKLLLREKE